MDPAPAERPRVRGGSLTPEQKDTYYLLWHELGIRPTAVAEIPDIELALALDRMPIWLSLLNGGGHPDEQKGAGGAPAPRTISFAQAVAEGLVPPSGEAMSGPITTPAD